jgi:hypothetical protein
MLTHWIRRPYRICLLLFCLSMAVVALGQGPPFLTDDPVPVDLHHYELYLFGAVDAGPSEVDSTGPAVEFNWGALPRTQLHFVLPLSGIVPRSLTGPDDPRHFGLGDAEVGIKYAFVLQTKHHPQIGIFPMFELPTGNYPKGLGVGRVWYKAPLWMYKDLGQWTVDGGGGYQIVPQKDYRPFAYGAFLVERKLGRKLELGTEIFTHGGEGGATPHPRSSTLLDVGGYYHLPVPGMELLAAYGRSIAGPSQTYSYVALYWTWGKQRRRETGGSHDLRQQFETQGLPAVR